MASHIILEELGLPYELKIVELGKSSETMEELKKYNPMNQVPTIVTEEGYGLSEGQAILQYIISKKPNELFPKSGEPYFKALEWMSFLSSSLHPTYSILFSPKNYVSDEANYEDVRKKAMERLHQRLAVAEKKFQGEFALGNTFTIVDAYLYVILSWSSIVKVDLSAYPKLTAFSSHVRSRPSVVAAYRAYSSK